MMTNLSHQFPPLSIAPMGMINYVSHHHLVTYHQANMTQTKLNDFLYQPSRPMTLLSTRLSNIHLNTFPFSLSFSLLISHQSPLFLPSNYNFRSSFKNWSQITSLNHVPSFSLHYFRLLKITLLGRMLICYGEIFPELSILPYIIKIVIISLSYCYFIILYIKN